MVGIGRLVKIFLGFFMLSDKGHWVSYKFIYLFRVIDE
jgi:hypothetical protein